MSASGHLFRFLMIQWLFVQLTHQISFTQQRYFKFEQTGSCPGASTKISKVEKFIVNQPDKNHYYLDGEIKFFRNITGPVKFHVRTTRCHVESDSQCVHSDGMQFGLCEHLTDENALWTPLVQSIEPKFMCPIKTGTYKIKNGTVDFSILARLPLEGFRYSINFKFYEMTKPKPVDILCLDFNVAITSASNSQSRRRGKGKSS